MTDLATSEKWRVRVGATIFVVSFASPFLLVPLVLRSPLATETKTVLSGLFAVGIPDVGMIAAVALMGKPGFEMLKRRLLQSGARVLPPDEVSPTRYRVGLVLFTAALLYGWLGPYIEWMLAAESGWIGHAVGDAVFVVSFFVLGGEFWDKLRALFDQKARVA